MSAATILHFSTGRYFRGGERQLEFLHSGLCNKGIHSILVCRKGGELAARGLRNCFPVLWLGEWDTIGLARLISACKQHRPALVHSHDGHSLAHASVAGATLGMPVVHTRRVLFSLGASVVSKWKYASCKALIGVSYAVSRKCKEAFPAVRVHTVHDGVDWTQESLSRAQARKDLGLEDGAFIIGSVAYFTKEKCLDLLVALANAISADFPAARIVCMGPMPQKPRAFPPNIIATGYRPNASRYYAAFDAYASVSSQEGLGSALLDAVVRDIPCAAVDAGGTPDLFPEGTRLVAPSDPAGIAAEMSRIMSSYDAASAAAAVCGTRARELFSVQSMISRTLEVYKTVASL